jgi:ubiquinone/menaquinone biosynthesis C-methylase UbiE
MDALEVRSQKQFDAWARRFDRTLGWSFSRANRQLLSLVAPCPGSRVLDVGCGTGILLDQMRKLDQDLQLHGVDIAFQMATAARAKLPGSVSLHQASASSLPYCSNAFDYVTCATSFHHYPDSLRALREMHRVLKPGGLVALLDPFTNGPLRRLLCGALDVAFRETDTRLYTSEQMRALFLQAGFANVSQRPYSYYKLATLARKPAA